MKSLAKALSVVILLGNLSAGRAQETPKLPDLIDNIRPSVVKVGVEIEGFFKSSQLPGNLGQCFSEGSHCIVGTGFFIDSAGNLVTADHVASDINVAIALLDAVGLKAKVFVGISMPNIDTGHFILEASTQVYSASIVSVDAEHDLALIKAFVDRPTVPVKLSHTRPRDAESIFACGYPMGQASLITTSGTIASVWSPSVLMQAKASGINRSVDLYIADLRVNPGNSGGPVFKTSDQSVIGVAVELHGNLGTLVPSIYVADFLTAQHVQWTPE